MWIALVVAVGTALGPQPELTLQGQAITLAHARAAFAKADKNASGKIELAEARAAGLTRYLTQGYDVNADRALDRSEFVIAHRMRAASAKRRVAPDLEAEVTRLLALRKARAAELRRRASAQSAVTAGSKGKAGGPAKQRLSGKRQQRAVRSAKRVGGVQSADKGERPRAKQDAPAGGSGGGV